MMNNNNQDHDALCAVLLMPYQPEALVMKKVVTRAFPTK
jgi:hypothetical protein